MGGIGKKDEPGKDATKAGDNARNRPPPPQADADDYEDGDIATPKRDRYGNDDEPL